MEAPMLTQLALFLSLGLDTLAVALGLGLGGLPRRRWLRVGLTFAFFEGAMPVVGLIVGHGLSRVLGHFASYAAAVLLIVVGALAIREALTGDNGDAGDDEGGDDEGGDDEGGDDEGGKAQSKARSMEGRQLLLTGLSVSLDELAVGFSLGVLRVPLGPALAYIAVQAFAVTFLGLSLGRQWGSRLGDRAELVSGVVLTLLGVALLLVEATGRQLL